MFTGETIGREILFLESAPSTNDKAMELAGQRDNPEGIVVVADRQSRGRGRQGRNWISPPGVNLYFSVILKPSLMPDQAPILTFAASVAAVKAIRSCTGLQASIKWPNDILIKNRKAGGILLEMKSEGNKIRFVIIGTGINVNMTHGDLEGEMSSLWTSLRSEIGKPVDRAVLLGRILEEMECCYKMILKGNKGALINEWISLNCTIGNHIRVRSQDRVIHGFAKNVNDRGELIVQLESGKTETLYAGDVTVLKE